MRGYFESSTKFIELTKSYNKEPVNSIFINTDKITKIERKNSRETYIAFSGSEGVWVVETPAEIIRKI